MVNKINQTWNIKIIDPSNDVLQEKAGGPAGAIIPQERITEMFYVEGGLGGVILSACLDTGGQL